MKSETGEESKEADVDVIKEKPLTQVLDDSDFFPATTGEKKFPQILEELEELEIEERGPRIIMVS
jgi:hypothetical protein